MIRKQKNKGNVKVTFILPGDHRLGRASVVGDFNGWRPGKNRFMKRSNGTYSASVDLKAGKRFAFRFLGENGEWADEPEADDHQHDEYGNWNGVVVT